MPTNNLERLLSIEKPFRYASFHRLLLTRISFHGACHLGFGTFRGSLMRIRAEDISDVSPCFSGSPVLLRSATTPAVLWAASRLREDQLVIQSVKLRAYVLNSVKNLTGSPG